LENLKNYPKDEINDEHIELLFPYTSSEEWFNPTTAKVVS